MPASLAQRARSAMRALALLAAALSMALLAVTPARADATGEQAARALVETLVADAHAAMSAGAADESARVNALEQAISEAFAFDVWERFLLGQHQLAPEKRERFRKLLPGFLAHLYAEEFGQGLAAEPEIVGARSVRDDVLVEARIPRAEGEPLPVEYRVRHFEERGPRVIDLMVGGISFLMLKRGEFGALIESDGIDALLAFMAERAG